IDFGTFLLMQSPSARSSQEIYARGVEIAQAAETLGFGNVWLAEHHFSTYGYLSRPTQLATYIAAKTKRIRVGTAVIVVPLQHPRPPIWITAQSPESVEAAVRRGFNVLTGGFGVPIERMAEFRRLFDRLVGEFKPTHPLQVGVQRAVYVAESQADARAAAEEARWNMRVTLSLRNQYERVEQGHAIPVPAPKEPDTDDLLDRFLVVGTPDTVIRQITRVRELVGISHFNCSFWFGDLEHARVMRSMERFAREVLPAFK